ncbi:MAG: hypothetical protein CM15mP100_7310 [Alphaproteobacteria bacterium]|nr:MAG: hypothetical protein CM15mP100_7310 [Alphaproteobacteria bacterium]
MAKDKQVMRVKGGSAVQQDRLVQFTFDGKSYMGYAGDTLASALLANNVHLVGRSFKYHRPRGIMAAGAEEANALVQLGTNGRVEPNLRATQVELYDGLVAKSQNRFPTLKFDVGQVNSLLSRFFPAGFYYKTFMWPASFWMTYEKFIRHAAGLGKVGRDHNDPDRYEKRHAHFDIVIAGGGAAGLMAAWQAGMSGCRVLLAEAGPRCGGWLNSVDDVEIDGQPVQDWIKKTLARLQAMENVSVLTRTTLFGYGDHNYLTLAQTITDHLKDKPAHLPRMRMWKVAPSKSFWPQGQLKGRWSFPAMTYLA